MKIKMNVICRKDKIYKNNTAPIHIRFTLNRQIRYVSTGFSIALDDWDFEQQRVKTPLLHLKETQHQIDSIILEYERKIKKFEALDMEITLDGLLERNGKRIIITVSDYFRQQIERIKSIGKIGTAVKYENCLALLSKCNPVNISFEQIDMNYLWNFETFLLGKDNTSNSVATKFSVFKAAYNRAIADRVFEPKDNPFSRFKVGKYWKPTRKRAITKEDVQKIKALELSENGNSLYLKLARDIFLFSYYSAGINFKDIATLKWNDIDNGRIYYQRHKTSKEMSCCLTPEVQHIIDAHNNSAYNGEDYIFPILNRKKHRTEQQIFNRIHKVLAKVNENLRLISKEIGLKNPITTYVARHTFATVLKRSGVNIAIISESLGHSDLATTQIYLDSFENSQIDEAMKNLL